jgi:CrcB protein
VVGFLGGFTTFSTFSYETMRLLEEGAFGAAAANALGSLALCLFGAQAGLWLGRWIVR